VTGGWHESSRFVTVDGEALHLVDVGEGGPPVVLIHGFLMSSYMWRKNLDALSSSRRVIALCLPGFGYSEVGSGPYDVPSQGRRVLEMMDALEIDRACLVGHSMGGAISLWIARHHPERVERMVLVCALVVEKPLSGPWLVTNGKLATLYRIFFRPAMAKVAIQRLAYNGMPVDAEYMSNFLSPLRRPGGVETALAVARECRVISNGSPAELALIGSNTLVLWGDSDRLLPERVGTRLADRLPQARFVSFDSCGHSPHEEQPERFNQEILEFLTTA
jgi:pimeloyl-ACP methyl ester carboxylesterase